MENNSTTVRIIPNTSFAHYFLDFTIHKSTTLEEQKIEPEFYVKWTGNIHAGNHHEIQIISDQLTNNVLNKSIPHMLHIHPSAKNKNEEYVYWTNHVPTFQEAISVLTIWCAGTIFSLENKKDFAGIFYEKQAEFLSFLRNDHGIKITSVHY